MNGLVHASRVRRSRWHRRFVAFVALAAIIAYMPVTAVFAQTTTTLLTIPLSSSTTSTTTTLELPVPSGCGDVNCTGTVLATDALLVLQHAVGIAVVISCRDECPLGFTTTSIARFAPTTSTTLGELGLAVPAGTTNLCADMNCDARVTATDAFLVLKKAIKQNVTLVCVEDCPAPFCGDGVLNQASEECDGTDDAACPGLCLANCSCDNPAPLITDFNPKSGPVGTLVTITGDNFSPFPRFVPSIGLPNQDGISGEAPIARFDDHRVDITIPTGADTGPLTVTVNGKSMTSSVPFQVLPSETFNVVAAPGAATVIAGQSTAFVVELNAPNGFERLATLRVNGLRAGLIASFTPSVISGGQGSLLTITAAADQLAKATAFQVVAEAQVDGIDIGDSVTLNLTVRDVTTTFMGRTVVADSLQTALGGVTITFLGRDSAGNSTGCVGQTVSDSAGNFAFTDLPPECNGEQLVRYNGLTSVDGEYAGVDLVYTITADQVTVAPVLIHLPRIDNAETVCVEQDSLFDQVFTFTTIPDLEVTVYAGTIFTPPPPEIGIPVHNCAAGFYPLIAIQVPVDRLPEEMPPGNTIEPFIVAFQPANTVASQPVAVAFPNLINTLPGTNMELSTLDPTVGVMVVYGTGTVSAGGTQIIPDFNPATPGKRFGLVHFDWHGARQPPPPPGPPEENPGLCGGGPGPGNPGCPPSAGDPIDLSSGLALIANADISLTSQRGSVVIRRIYRTLSDEPGPFGIGTNHNYGLRLDTDNPVAAQMINLIAPDGSRRPFVNDGTGVFTNTTSPSLRGDVMTVQPSGAVDLRFKNGSTFHFIPATAALGSLLESIGDPNGNQISLIRDSVVPVRINEIVDPVGRRLLLKYDAANRITSISDPIGRVVRYSYNGQGTLAEMTDPAGGITRYGYDVQNRLTQITDARGVVVAQNSYGANGRVSQQIQADGGVLSFDYILANPAVAMSPVLQTTVTQPSTPDVPLPADRQMTYRFDPQGFLLDVTNALGQKRIFDREPGSNLLLAVHGPASCTVCGDAQGGDQKFTYDANGNPLTLTNGAGETTTFTYEPIFDRIDSITDPQGHVTSLGYDTRGNLTSITDALNQITGFEYDSSGLPTAIIDALNERFEISYDSFGNPVIIRDPLSNETAILYDAVSRPIQLADALGRKTSISFDALDRVIATTDALGRTTRASYDAVGHLATVADARGNTTTLSYDPMGRLEARTDSLGASDTRQYDSRGNLTQFVDRRGQTSLFAYDTLGRLVAELYQDGSSVMRRYDDRGRLIQATDSTSGTFSFSYNPAGHLTDSAGPFGSVTYTRDPLGRVKTRQVVGQSAVSYAYDIVGNLASAIMPEAGATFTYDVRNRLDLIRRTNGVVTDQDYDALGRITSIVHSGPAGIIDLQSYAYDRVGNRISADRLIAAPLATQLSVNQYETLSDRLTQRGVVSYTHDANGNRLSEAGLGGITSYSWDARNRLSSISRPDGATTSFLYDFVGNLIQMDDRASGSVVTADYLLDTLTNVVQVRDSGGETLSILTGRVVDQHLASIDGGGALQFALTDAINSTVATADGAGLGNSAFAYEPYGATSFSGVGSHFQFTGRVPIGTGLYHYRARYYDPIAGSFISEDPITFLGGDINRYRYVRNNPVNFVDPFGLLDRRLRLVNASREALNVLETFGRGVFVVGLTTFVVITSEISVPVLVTFGAGVALFGAEEFAVRATEAAIDANERAIRMDIERNQRTNEPTVIPAQCFDVQR